jgi:asparagine N-glycosylation enzyme membrane subunit Stt3
MSEEIWSRKEFKIIALASLGIGLAILAIPSLYSLLKLMINIIGKPFIYVNNTIGNAILEIIGNNPVIFLALFFIATAAIFGVGYFIKDENDRDFYQLLIHLSWFVTPLIILLSTLASASESIMVGFSFLVYLSPIYLFAAYKGLRSIINSK